MDKQDGTVLKPEQLFEIIGKLFVENLILKDKDETHQKAFNELKQEINDIRKEYIQSTQETTSQSK